MCDKALAVNFTSWAGSYIAALENAAKSVFAVIQSASGTQVSGPEVHFIVYRSIQSAFLMPCKADQARSGSGKGLEPAQLKMYFAFLQVFFRAVKVPIMSQRRFND